MLVSSVTANVIGFDFGSTFFKVTLVVPGKTFSIVENVTSARKTNSQMTINDEQRLYSTDSFNGQARYPKTTFSNVLKNLGTAFNAEEIQKIKDTKFILNDFVEDKRGLIGY
jgi:hypoxia up-regulated 1